METTQENSLCSYLYLKLAKTSCFSYYIICFFFYKIGAQEGRTGSAQEVGGWHWGREEVTGKGRRMNIVQIMYTHVCKCKNDTC
jgi:hypothetical protein